MGRIWVRSEAVIDGWRPNLNPYCIFINLLLQVTIISFLQTVVHLLQKLFFWTIYVHVGRPGTAQAHKSTFHKGTAHKSTYLIMGRVVPARVPSHRPAARPTISYVCQASPNSPKYLNVPDRPIYIQQ
jgi:hypothetical protein